MGADLAGPLADLYARVPRGMRLGLDDMRAACTQFGHPERAFDVVHVAGTNGKGSVSAMTEAVLRADGRRTGLYTSPHLCRFAERIRVGGAPIDDATLAEVLRDVLARAPDLSFFEAATLAALVAFRAAKVDVAVIEVGIGGRLDATNVVPAETTRAAAITRIALDHTDRLGATLGEIAHEKAGIAKAGVPVVVGPIGGDARRVIEADVARAGGHVVDAMEDAEAAALVASTSVNLRGAHQADNARIAAVLTRLVGAGDAARRSGLAGVTWPGRLEWLLPGGTGGAAPAAGAPPLDGPYLLDGAHNPDGAAALAAYLGAIGPDRTVLVFGALADKAWPEMLDHLAPCARARVYVAPQGRTPADPRHLAARHRGDVAADVGRALAHARRLGGSDAVVVVCGSMYLVGEARAHLLGLPRDPIVAL